jgi:hypothetical protein
MLHYSMPEPGRHVTHICRKGLENPPSLQPQKDLSRPAGPRVDVIGRAEKALEVSEFFTNYDWPLCGGTANLRKVPMKTKQA